MPGDTKVKKTQNGWIDVDEPNKTFGARRQARDFRRYRLTGTTPTKTVKSTPTPATPVTPDPVAKLQAGLSKLQARLLTRMTLRQGVFQSEALEVILDNGYNAAASYGHMRVAGATHDEALIVIGVGLPDVSLAYGIARARGKDHTAALREALNDDDD